MSLSLSVTETGALLAVFTAYEDAYATYRYEVDWSSDIAIPQSAIEASYERTLNRWQALMVVVTELGLRTTPACDVVLPKRIRGGRARLSSLRAWIDANGHRGAGPRS